MLAGVGLRLFLEGEVRATSGCLEGCSRTGTQPTLQCASRVALVPHRRIGKRLCDGAQQPKGRCDINKARLSSFGKSISSTPPTHTHVLLSIQDNSFGLISPKPPPCLKQSRRPSRRHSSKPRRAPAQHPTIAPQFAPIPDGIVGHSRDAD